jgi:hypothetical protein
MELERFLTVTTTASQCRTTPLRSTLTLSFSLLLSGMHSKYCWSSIAGYIPISLTHVQLFTLEVIGAQCKL